jgi:hypothetical protein
MLQYHRNCHPANLLHGICHASASRMPEYSVTEPARDFPSSSPCHLCFPYRDKGLRHYGDATATVKP